MPIRTQSPKNVCLAPLFRLPSQVLKPSPATSRSRESPLTWLNAYFGFDRHGTTLSQEIIAGLTTFTTMSYIVVVNPAIVSAAGIPEGPSFVATALIAVAGCYLMAFYANRPFAVAPYMGENAFIAFTVCKALGFAWQTALAAIFIAGILFVLMTVLRLRQWIVDGVPHLASLQIRGGNRAVPDSHWLERKRIGCPGSSR